jgi:hypothetical protein
MQREVSQKSQSRRLFYVRLYFRLYFRLYLRKKTNVSLSAPRLRHVGYGAEQFGGNCTAHGRGQSIYNASARYNPSAGNGNASG